MADDLAGKLAEREMNAHSLSKRLQDEEVMRRWAMMSIALRGMPQVDDVLDRVCCQAIEANELRAALAEALEGWERENDPQDGDVLPSIGATAKRVAELRAKFLGTP